MAAEESSQDSQVHIINSIKDTKLGISVILMEKKFTIGELTALSPSNVLNFDLPADTLADVAVNGKKIAKGTVVRVKNHFGVKIQELT